MYLNCRYEIEYDEIRTDIATEIGKRFLGIEIERCNSNNHLPNHTSQPASRNHQNQSRPIQSDGGTGDGGGGGVISTKKESGDRHLESETGDNGTSSKEDNETNDQGTPSKVGVVGEKDELVLDVLNDDLIARVRDKLLSKFRFAIRRSATLLL